MSAALKMKRWPAERDGGECDRASRTHWSEIANSRHVRGGDQLEVSFEKADAELTAMSALRGLPILFSKGKSIFDPNLIPKICLKEFTPPSLPHFATPISMKTRSGKLIDEQFANGVAGRCSRWHDGESPTLSYKEHERVIEAAVAKTAKRGLVIAGTGSMRLPKRCE